MAKSDKKYWCKLCSRYHKDRDTYLKHKERFEKRKERHVKKGVIPKPRTEPTVVVSSDPAEIAKHMMSSEHARIITTKRVAKKVETLIPKTVYYDAKKLPVIKTKPGQDTPHVKSLMKVYTCNDCEHFLKIGKYLVCRRWHAPRQDFSIIKDTDICMQFSRRNW